MKSAGVLLILAVLIPARTQPAPAQAVAGRLVDRATRGVIDGAAVRLTDTADVVVAQTRSDSSGEFLFTLARPGRYRLYFFDRETALGASEPFDVGAEDFHQRIYMLDVIRDAPVYFGFQVTKQVAPVPTNQAPRYPEELRARGVEGDVLMQFVVDTTGKPVRGTLRVLRSTDPAFAAAVERAIMWMRFLPAELADGRRVRQLVQMPFQFRLTH